MKYLYNWLREYFAFSNTEMRGVFVLTLLAFMLLLAPYIYKPWLRKEYHHLQSDQKILDSLVMMIKAQSVIQSNFIEGDITLFAFNPNSAEQSTFELLGIPPTIAERIMNYREKGGIFRKKSDLLKIYGFPKEVYQTIESYIELPADYIKPEKTLQKADIQPFDINLADSIQLVQLRGIGSVLSTRIIKFRNALGGFYSATQLAEVYGIDDEALEQLNKYSFIADHFIPQKLNLNTLDFKELNKHPYISYELTKAILNHRRTYGPFSSVDDLKEVHLMDGPTFAKLSPYVTI